MRLSVIISGANGFIGKALTDYMRNQGYNVIGWDVSKTSDPVCKFRSVDMTRLAEIESALSGITPDVIIHCAGSANVSDSVINPERDFDLNVGITHNLLHAIHRQGLNQTRLVYLSSAAVYGNPQNLPLREIDEIHPISPYALHKSMCEDMCRYFVENYDFDIRIARIFSAYGPGLRKQIFWDMYQKLRKTGKLEMFGDGTESRDFIYIDDLIRALSFIAINDLNRHKRNSSDEMVINVANGEEITIRKITETFADCMGVPHSVISFNGMKRTGDPHNWCADIARLREIGYEKQVSIEDGIHRYCEWVVVNASS